MSKRGIISIPAIYKKKCNLLTFNLVCNNPYDLAKRSNNIKPIKNKEINIAGVAIRGSEKAITIINGNKNIPKILLIKNTTKT